MKRLIVTGSRLSLSRMLSSILLVLPFTYCCGFAQPAYTSHIAKVRHLNVSDGLAHREVYTIFQDHTGFIWLGTRQGLNRYDGYSFQSYSAKTTGFTTNRFHEILEDREGYLWLFTYKDPELQQGIVDVNLFHPARDSVRSWSTLFEDQAPWFSPQEISRVIYYDHEQLIILEVFGKGVFEYRSGSGFQKIPIPESYTFHPLSKLDSLCFLGWWNQSDSLIMLAQWDEKQATMLPIFELEDGQDPADFHLLSTEDGFLIHHIGKTEEWLRTYKPGAGDREFDWQSLGAAYRYRYDPNLSSRIFCRPSDQSMWYISANRFFIMDYSLGILHNFKENHQNIINSRVKRIFFDQEQNAWLATNNGVYIIQFKTNPFTCYLNKESPDAALNTLNSCRGIWVNQEEQSLNVNTYHGQYIINLRSGDTLHRPPNKGVYLPLLKSPSGILYFASDKLHIQYPGLDEPEDINWDPAEPPSNIWSLYRTKKGQLWLGTERGLAYLHPQDSTLHYYQPDTIYKQLLGSTVYHFFPLNAKEVLLCTSTGIFRFHFEKGMQNHYHSDAPAPYTIPFDIIYHIHADTDGTYWLATGGSGLIHWDMETGTSELFTAGNGIPNNTIYAVYEDKRGFLWMSSDYGIICFNRKTQQSKVFLPVDGIPHVEFNRISHFQGADGTLYFGGLNGIAAFNPLRILPEEESDVPLEVVRLQQIAKTSNKLEDFTTSFNRDRRIRLTTDNRFFILKVALLDYFHSDHIRYAYRIEGFQKDWIYTNDNELTVSGLPYGRFELVIKGQGSNGLFSRHEIHIPIEVVKPLYLRSGFLGVMGLLFAVLILILYLWRTAGLNRRKKVLEQLVAERTRQINEDKKIIERQAEELRKLDHLKSRIFTNVAHELRTPLTLLVGPINTVLKSNELSNRNYSMMTLAQQSLRKILNLINEILDLSKLESGKVEIHPERLAIKHLIEGICANFESNAIQKNIQFSYTSSAPDDLMLLVDKAKLEKIISNFLSNAFKFTPNGGNIKVTTELVPESNNLQIRVADDGFGIDEAELPVIFNRFYQSKNNPIPGEGTGIGLAICREYAQLLGGRVWAESRPHQGSCFYLSLPVAVSDTIPVKPSEAIHDQESEPAQSGESRQVTVNPPPGTAFIKEKSRVLVVEDNKSLREYLDLILQDRYQVTSVGDGRAALDFLRLSTPDAWPSLIISDLMMPVMGGFELLAQLRNDPKWKYIPVIFLTAKSERSEKIKALRIGVDDYITKPFSDEELLARMNALIRNYHTRINYLKEIQEYTKTTEVQELESNSSIWIEKVNRLVQQELSSFSFSVNELADLLSLSRRQLYRKIKAETGLTPSQYIQELRYQKAYQLLEKQTYPTVKAVAYEVGFRDVVHFSRQYKKRFGKLPSDYL